MSYNGIGIPTARGTGTNGFVQKSQVNVRDSNFSKRERIARENEKSAKLVKIVNKDKELVDHEYKRQLEIKVSEYRDQLEDDESLGDDEIEEACKKYRQELLEKRSKGSVNSARAKRDIELDY